MKKSLLTTLIVGNIFATFVSTGVSASFNSNKDPNGDGQLNLADAVYINQYLYGNHEPWDLSELDVDDNDVVSTRDSRYVQLYTLGLLDINHLLPTEVEPSRLNLGYDVYNAQTGSYLRNYSLSVPDHNNMSSKGNLEKQESERGVVGLSDDRISDWSNRGTAKIMCSVSEYAAGYRGSGFVVGPHTIATAAHVVFDTDTDHACKLSEILLFDANHTSHSFTPVEYHIPTVFKNASSYSTTADYALITVEEDISDYDSFNLGAITDTAATNQLDIKAVGFPQKYYYNIQSPSVYSEVLINNHTLHDERLSSGHVISSSFDGFLFDADVSPGNSGGPIYTVESLNGTTYKTVVGIVIAQQPNLPVNASYNYGYRFNASVLKFLKNNNNIQY